MLVEFVHRSSSRRSTTVTMETSYVGEINNKTGSIEKSVVGKVNKTGSKKSGKTKELRGQKLASSADLLATEEALVDVAESIGREAGTFTTRTLKRKIANTLESRLESVTKDTVKKLLREMDSNCDGVIQKIELRKMVRNQLCHCKDSTPPTTLRQPHSCHAIPAVQRVACFPSAIALESWMELRWINADI